MESMLLGAIMTALAMGFFFWKYPALMKELFSFKKKESSRPAFKPVSQDVERVTPKHTPTYEDIGSINEPIKPPAVVPKHEIIRHDYYRAVTTGDLWPRWRCKCGASGYTPTSSYKTLEKTQDEAQREGQAHVVNSLKAEEMLKKTNGNFAW